MTVGEIMMIGEDIGKQYIDDIAHQLVKTMISKRKEQIQRRLRDVFYKDSHAKMKKSLSGLTVLEESGLPQAAYDALFNETRNRLMVSFRQAADGAHLDLTNAEYFGFTGRLR